MVQWVWSDSQCNLCSDAGWYEKIIALIVTMGSKM